MEDRMNPGISESVILPNSTRHHSAGKRTIRFKLQPNPDKFRFVDVEMELRGPTEKREFSACALIWDRRTKDCAISGQCLDEIRPEQTDNPSLYRVILKLWKRWHLNGMRAGCEHQRGWEKRKLDESLPLTQANMAIWTYEKDHPNGLLCKPCHVCGYKYGSQWLFEPIEIPDYRTIVTILSIPEGEPFKSRSFIKETRTGVL